MALTKVYLDKRRLRKDGRYPLKLEIVQNRVQQYISLGIYIKTSEWDGHRVVNRPDKDSLNLSINNWKNTVDSLLMSMGKMFSSLSATELRDLVMCEIDPKKKLDKEKKKLVVYNLQRFAASHKDSTRDLYLATLRRMRSFMGDKLDKMSFEDITRQWLNDFENYLAQTATKNARNIHLRNIRAVVNDAIDNGITANYPFRKFKIKPEETVKRSLSVEELRTLFNYPVEKHQQQYLDMFKLIFFLCGINIVDLYGLTEIKKGRVEYNRSKTHKLYSIKVEKEAMEIIEKYKGQKALLNIADRHKDYRNYRHRMNDNLQRIGKVERKGRGGKKVFKPLFPDLTTYWARHTWATIAAELDIPNETIAAALGHEFGNPTTAIYIRFDQKKVDEANRKVIDYVLNGK